MMLLLLRRALVVLAIVLVTWVAVGCESSKTEGADLRGVFDRKPLASGVSASASAVATAKPKGSADAGPRIAPLTRKPPAGPCLPPSGNPVAKLGRVARRPACRRARVMEWQDENGMPRYACLFAHRKSSERTPLPLVLFFHGESDSPTAVHRKTKLRRHYGSLDLTGDPHHPGFLILAPQGRRIAGQIAFDTDHVSVANVDVLTVDHFVAVLLSEGIVDHRQIYAMGESGGGAMAALYAMLRPRRIAAFGTYGAAPSQLVWSCEGRPPPAAIVYRACDAVTPCADVEQWLGARQDAQAPTLAVRLGAGKATEPTCVLSKNRCRVKKGTANHNRWPKGRETEMLEFMSRYSLAGPAGGITE
ncbi:MAG: hypothetical protein DRI90_09300 [Deltaproteobacteria bacterium]|nr:MAG: hypothetical protein DRI90_09300 [Deltaproteobacteria bacterium]